MSVSTNIKLIATDLDGTLLDNEKRISGADWDTLKELGRKGVLRVAATGRSMFKVEEVLPEGAPFDYIVFSSGSGVFDWERQRICTHEEFDGPSVQDICQYLLKKDLNFLVFDPIPYNNLFRFRQGKVACPEFRNYLVRHKENCSPFDGIPSDSGQVMCILPNDEKRFEDIKKELHEAAPGIKVIRTTSPVNDHFIWLEIFPETVSKGHGLRWICNRHLINKNETAALGNDFNDLDMLEFVEKPFVIQNSPEALKKQFPVVSATNNHSGFTKFVEQIVENFNR